MNRMLCGRAAGIALAATVAATVAGLGAGPADAALPALCGTTAVFKTEIQWGGDAAPWHPDADLEVLLKNRNIIVDKTTAPVGTTLNWSGPNGNGAITFKDRSAFAGTAQFPNEGPVGYRGTLNHWGPPICDPAADFKTEIQWGGDAAPWHPDADLVALVKNRHTVIDRTTAPAGTKVSWTGPNGNADITFNARNTFSGTAQFPGEGPVGYRSAH
jgi:hypothetical protein